MLYIKTQVLAERLFTIKKINTKYQRLVISARHE